MKTVTKIEEIEEFDLYDITVSNDHCFKLENGVVAHNSMYPKTIVKGGNGIYLSSDNIYIIGRQQQKDGTDVIGYNFVINIEKSRHVREKSKIPITVMHDGGISKWSGLLDMAQESGHLIKPQVGWFSRVNKETGEIEDKKYRAKDTNTAEFWGMILNQPSFNAWIKEQYQVSNGAIMTDDEEAQNIAETLADEEDAE